ncbi:ABC transporter permease [Ktedonobacter robiniae]|uniref:Autoinducer 2 import system permease protein LsrD n=1 Tax=Ktedonobacter robiniae TaxID=2778365 RepID=A0ABQ3UW27_9CHLR|nr:ABC transporter permease [Ktedonobacter robiniae]GHO56968.1 sugar ABC transporter permease [Ktedonobacter robiniae]
MNWLRKNVGSWEALLLVLLVLVMILGSSLSPYFLSFSNFSLMASDVMEKAIMALAMTLIIVVGEIDLSVASILGLASVVLGVCVRAGLPIGLGMLLVLVLGACAGLLNGVAVTRLGLPSLVVTLGTLGLYRGLAYVVLGDQAVSDFSVVFTNFGFGVVPGTLIPWTVLVFIVLALVFVVLLHWSSFGRRISAVGNNKEAARFSGIRVDRLKLTLFVISGAIAALAGILFTARFASARADNAVGFELDVVTIVLLGGVNICGGRGSLVGVILSLIIIAMLHNALGLANISGDIQNTVIGVLLIFSVLGPNLAQRIQATITRRRLKGATGARAPVAPSH